MEFEELKRWGLLLDTLNDMSDVERQVIVQGDDPASFVPDTLLDRWQSIFRGGWGLTKIGLSELTLSILLEFDHYLDQLVELLPEYIDDKEDYIRYDEAWQTVRELADWTLSRIAEMGQQEETFFSDN